MRNLSASLVLVALLATIGLSWILDNLYLSLQDEDTLSGSDTVVALEKVTINLANTIRSATSEQAFVEQWQGDYILKLIPIDALHLPVTLEQQLVSGAPLTLESEELVTIHVLVPDTQDLLLLEFTPESDSEQQSTLRYWITSLFYVLFIGAFLLWLTPLLQRLLTLRKVAKDFGEGHLDRRIEVSSISYIRDVESEFNHMAQRIEDLVGDVKLLSSAVSHDLRTPLAKLRMGLDTLREEQDPEVREAYFERLDQHLDSMVELVETLLQYARMDQTMIQPGKQRLPMSELTMGCITQQTSPIHFQCALTPEQTEITGDTRYLKIAINNLLQNAIKYGNGSVKVSLTKERDTLLLAVEDNGPGVPQELIHNIFKPFVRGANKDKQGFGVGLAIVKRVFDWHEAVTSVAQSDSLGGARFEVRMKKAQ